MTFMAVFTAVDALTLGLAVRVLLGGRRQPVAVSPSSDETRVAELVARTDGIGFCEVDAVSAPDPAVGVGPVRGLRQGERGVEGDVLRLDQIRQDYLAEVSHELKTPVGAVALLAEAVLGAAEDPHQVRWFSSKILHEANRLGALVTELIALSRLQGSEQLPELAIVDADEVVQEALVRCRLAVESTRTEITVDSPGGLLLTGDATLLVTALSNLIHNAVSYSPPGGPVMVRTRLVNDFAEIAVTDRGRGIEPEYQERVFERFFRVDQALSRSAGGTGLGLAIAKRIAVNHGGDVQLRSKPHIGSTFTLRIPAHQDSRQHISRASSGPEYITAPL